VPTKTKQHTVYLSLGSNLGERKQMLSKAVVLINAQAGSVCAESKLYQTAPEGFNSENDFLNQVVCIQTTLSPLDLLQVTEQIEKTLGRTSKSINGIYHDRPIDIDILLYDDCVMESPQLTIPHPRMHQRLFVLEPLCELCDNLPHPLLHQSMRQLLNICLNSKRTNDR